MKGFEIERKWLIDANRIPHDLATAARTERIEQAYISFSPTIRIRKINGGERFVLTVKSHGGLVREEFETELSECEFETLMKKHEGVVVSKTRYVFPLQNGLEEEIDIFNGGLEGLAYMEIEFPDEAAAVSWADPPFALADVSLNKAFSNASLARYGMPEGIEKICLTDARE